MDYVGNPSWLINFLHNLQLQLFFRFLICLLNDAGMFILLNSSGRLFQSLTLPLAWKIDI